MLSIIFRVFSFNKKSEQRKVGVRPRFCVLVLVVAFFYSNISHAAKLPLGPLTAQDIENEQKQRLEQIENNTNALQGLVPVPVISESQPIEDTQCINVREIRFQAILVIATKCLLKLLSLNQDVLDLIPSTVSTENIQSLHSSWLYHITRFYDATRPFFWDFIDCYYRRESRKGPLQWQES